MEYKALSAYLKEKYGKRLKKICVDGGFSCPNRDGKCGVGGCIFCGERGAGEHIKASGADSISSITEQVKRGLSGSSEDDLFIVYFQNFTNTYAPVSTLKARYDAALIDERIKVLDVGTRPDCIDEDTADLLASYKERGEVWVELGLQSASDETARLINRGYGLDTFRRAMDILRERGLPVVVHLMIGLPGEGDSELRETVKVINEYNPFGIKLHSTYVMEGTRLAELYKSGEYTPVSREDYVRRVLYVLSNIDRGTVVHRLTGDCPRDLLLAPLWTLEKSSVIEEIRRASKLR